MRAGRFVFIVVTLATLLYCTWSQRSIGYIDSGELAACCVISGIPHPTGYPAFSILGRLGAILPTAHRMIDRLHIFNALISALSIGMMLFVVRDGFRRFDGSRPAEPNRETSFLAASSALFLFNGSILENALEFEVHALQLLLISCVLLSLTRFQLATSGGERFRWFSASLFSLGFCLTNHASSLALLPAVTVFFLVSLMRNSCLNAARLSAAACFFGLAFSVYLYLPLRSTQSVPLDWGDPASFETFLRHVTGWQFRVWFFGNPEAFSRNLLGFISGLPHTTRLMCFLAPFGLVRLIRSNLPWALFLLTVSVSNSLYVSGYDIHDLHPYYLLSELAILLMSAHFIGVLISTPSSLKTCRLITGLIVSLIVFQTFVFSAPPSRRGFDVPERYTRMIIDSLPADSMIMSRQWDYLCSPLVYLQTIESYRTDVVMIERELLRRSWYFAQIDRLYGEIFRRNRRAIEAFLRFLRPFERQEKFDPNSIQSAYIDLIRSLIDTHPGPCFITPDVLDETEAFRGYNPRPFGLVLQITGPEFDQPDPDRFVLAVPDRYRNERLTKALIQLLDDTYRRNARYFRSIGRLDLANHWGSLAESFDR